jgi:SAM-dependent methyltransferase
MLMHKCRFCHTPLVQTFCNLGDSPLSNAYLNEDQFHLERFYPLHSYVCSSCFLVQLPQLHSPAEIFSDYAYFSSYSTSWLNHAKNYAHRAKDLFNLNTSSQVIEIASNDGYLLQYFQQLGIPTLGIEPAENVAKKALEKGIPTKISFFGKKTAQTLPKADLLIGNNVLAHVPDLNDFVAGMKDILKRDGVITMEFPHLMKLIQKNQFDTIYHEHFSYFSFLTVYRIFEHHELTIFDVDQLPTHGGSLRIYAAHQRKRSKKVDELIKEEKKEGMDRLSTYTSFHEKVVKVREDFLDFLAKNRHAACYGAPAKGNTLLNFCAIKNGTIPFTVDLNPLKQGKFLPGTHIPIFSPDKIKETEPKFVIILPWNLKKEIMEQLSYIREWGGKFVIPIPKLEIFD